MKLKSAIISPLAGAIQVAGGEGELTRVRFDVYDKGIINELADMRGKELEIEIRVKSKKTDENPESIPIETMEDKPFITKEPSVYKRFRDSINIKDPSGRSYEAIKMSMGVEHLRDLETKLGKTTGQVSSILAKKYEEFMYLYNKTLKINNEKS